jgi:hypothetical protein
MSGERTVKKVFKNTPEGNKAVGKPRKRWLENDINDPKKMDVRRLREIVKKKRCLEIDPEGGQGPTWTVEGGDIYIYI